MTKSLLSLLKKPTSLHYLLIALLVFAFLGFLDASYLTLLHYKNAIPPCSIAHGCETVLTSKYATFFGIPLSLIGIGYYLVVLVLTGIFWQNSNVIPAKAGIQKRNWIPDQVGNDKTTSRRVFPDISSLLLLLTTLGLLVGIYLVYLQAFVLHAFCQYCLASEIIDFLLFDISWWLWKRSS